MAAKMYSIKSKNDLKSLVDSVVIIKDENLEAVKENFDVTEIKTKSSKEQTEQKD